MLNLDKRTMDIARTAGISALAAAIAENLFDNLTVRFQDNALFKEGLPKMATQVASGVGLIALGSNQRKTSSGKQVGELLSTVGVGVITSGVYTYAVDPIGDFIADAPLIGKGKPVAKDDTTAVEDNGADNAGYTMLPHHDYTPVALNGYQATPTHRQDETPIHLGNAHYGGIQKSELNTYQVVN